jgi:hypothetical protein
MVFDKAGKDTRKLFLVGLYLEDKLLCAHDVFPSTAFGFPYSAAVRPSPPVPNRLSI